MARQTEARFIHPIFSGMTNMIRIVGLVNTVEAERIEDVYLHSANRTKRRALARMANRAFEILCELGAQCQIDLRERISNPPYRTETLPAPTMPTVSSPIPMLAQLHYNPAVLSGLADQIATRLGIPGHYTSLRGSIEDVVYTLARDSSLMSQLLMAAGSGDPMYAPFFDREIIEVVIAKVQEACEWFANPDCPPMMQVVDGRPISDERVREAIAEITRHLQKEANNRRLQAFDLSGLPWERQRALAEQIDLIFHPRPLTSTTQPADPTVMPTVING